MDCIVINDSKIRVQPAWQYFRRQSYGETINKLVEKGIVKNNASPEDQCFKCGDKGHHSVLCPNPYKRKRQYFQQNAQCFLCGKYGHYRNHCPSLPQQPHGDIK
jgi:hypothetical protein